MQVTQTDQRKTTHLCVSLIPAARHRLGRSFGSQAPLVGPPRQILFVPPRELAHKPRIAGRKRPAVAGRRQRRAGLAACARAAPWRGVRAEERRGASYPGGGVRHVGLSRPSRHAMPTCSSSRVSSRSLSRFLVFFFSSSLSGRDAPVEDDGCWDLFYCS